VTIARSGGRGTYVVVEWSGGGGLGHYAWLLADAIGGQVEDVVLCTRADPELAAMPRRHRVITAWPRAPRRLKGRVRGAAIACQWALGWLRVLKAAGSARRHGRCVVHIQATARLVEAPFMLGVRLLGCTLISTAHNPVPHDAKRWQVWVQRLLYRIPQGVVTHSEGAAKTIRNLGNARLGILVVPCGPFSPIADHFCAAADRGGQPLRLAHLGMIRPYKRFDLVARSVGQVLEERPGAMFRVAGRASDAVAVEESLRPLPPHQVSVDLSYLPISRMVEEAAQADVVVLGHRSDSESGVAHLVLGAGTPVVGPMAGPIGALLEDAADWTYDPDDVDGAARAIRRVLEQTEVDRSAVRARARALEDKVPSWDELATRHLLFVASVRAATRPSG